MQIKILCFGKLDNQGLKETFDFYANKIQKFANLEVIELKEQYQAEDNVNLMNNSKLLEDKLTNYQDYQKVLLDVSSKEVDSIQFSQLIDQNKNFKSGKLVFVIGPSDGYSSELVNKYQTISFGKITLPHQLFRVVLVEQIYRSFKILRNEKYHK